MKVLLTAFSCHPGRGSEPGIGWGVSQTVAKEHEVWVLTDAANRDGIEKAMKRLSNPRLRFVYIGHSFLRSVVQKANTLGIPLGSYLYSGNMQPFRLPYDCTNQFGLISFIMSRSAILG